MSETYLNKAGLDTLAAEIKEKFQKKISPTNTIPSDSVIDTDQTHKFATAEQLAQIGTNTSNITSLGTRITTAEGDIDALEALVPSQATSSNQLADKAFVNSSIATATAVFQGTYHVVDDLGLSATATNSDIVTKLNIAATATGAVVSKIDNTKKLNELADNNDYVFVQMGAAGGANITEVKRFKRSVGDSTSWVFEYSLNNSGFTAAQWAAINSGITTSLVTQIGTNQTNIGTIQSTMVTDVKYDTTNKKIQQKINGSYSDVVTTAVLKSDMGLATVATSGSYNDLTNKPTIPTDTNQKIKVGSNTFGANAEVNLVAGDCVTFTTVTTAGSEAITINATGVTPIKTATNLWSLTPGVYFGALKYMYYTAGTAIESAEGYKGFLIVRENGNNSTTFTAVGTVGRFYYGIAQASNAALYACSLNDVVRITNYASKIYGTNTQGGQTTLNYSTSATANYIVQRDSNGQVLVPETPTADGQASSKKYVDTGLGNKQDTLTFDTTPTASSTNPVTSGGIYTALAAKLDTDDYITQQYIETIFD